MADIPDTVIEELQFHLEYALRKCPHEHLLKIAEELSLTADELAGGTHIQTRRALCDAFDSVILTNRYSLFERILPLFSEEDRNSLLTLVKTKSLESSRATMSTAPEVDERVKELEKDLAAAKEELARSTTTGRTVERELTDDHETASVASIADLLKAIGLSDSGTSAFRKEFRVNNTIGGPIEKRLDCISLQGQVAEAKRRGYAESEIVFGIKRAVCSGTQLRMYLDSRPDLPLERIMQIIRGSYREKSASDLFQQSNLLSQMDTENAQEFLVRALTF